MDDTTGLGKSAISLSHALSCQILGIFDDKINFTLDFFENIDLPFQVKITVAGMYHNANAVD